MRFVGNAIWFVLCGGFILGTIWIIGAAILCLTIVGIPLAKSAIEIAKMSYFPFGKDVVHVYDLKGLDQERKANDTKSILGFLVNIIWACTFGLTLFLGNILSGIIACILIITIPFGIQSFKLAGISLWPVGRRVVTKELAEEVRKRNAKKDLDKIRGEQSD